MIIFEMPSVGYHTKALSLFKVSTYLADKITPLTGDLQEMTLTHPSLTG